MKTQCPGCRYDYIYSDTIRTRIYCTQENKWYQLTDAVTNGVCKHGTCKKLDYLKYEVLENV